MYSASVMGKTSRLGELFEDQKTLIVPVDDSLIFGPCHGLFDIEGTIKKIIASKPKGILGYIGSYTYYFNAGVPLILNVTASTVMGTHTEKVIVSSIEDAITLNASCIAVHVNFSSKFENEMLRNFSLLVREADRSGLPVMAIAYPRAEIDGKDQNYDALRDDNPEAYTRIVAHCTRIGAELGADIIKTQYTGDPDSFSTVIKASMGTPVIIAGGPQISVDKSFARAIGAIEAGAAGVSFGRNVFNANNIQAYLKGLGRIVFSHATLEEALRIYAEVSD